MKPSNLMLDRGVRVQVRDVALARPRWAAGGLTRAGLVVGTPDYMAPEQADDARRVGPPADHSALGCRLYRKRAGWVPFPDGAAVAKALARLPADPQGRTPAAPGRPAGLGGVVSRLLARRPQDRFPRVRGPPPPWPRSPPPPIWPPAAAGNTDIHLPALGDAPTPVARPRPPAAG